VSRERPADGETMKARSHRAFLTAGAFGTTRRRK